VKWSEAADRLAETTILNRMVITALVGPRLQ
jgi:hypothetical protein